MITQKQLYLHNRAALNDITGFPEAIRWFESDWIHSVLQQTLQDSPICSLQELLYALDNLIEQEAGSETEAVRYVMQDMGLAEFRVLVQEFALDGLTEAQSFYYIMPRLPLSAQLPMLRILIDEFGSGNPKRLHTQLYINLLQELGLPTTVDAYLDRIGASSFAFVNQFYWLTIRADDPSYFAGAITYLESIIPHFFPCYVEACTRLDIRHHQYYSEHCHIDHFHAREGRRLLAAMAEEHKLDAHKAWQGICLASAITNMAFVDAVQIARDYEDAAYEHTCVDL